MKKVYRVITNCLLTFLLLSISGCWDSKEVEDLAITTLIAWDRITEDNVDKWQVSSRILDMEGKKSGEQSGQKSLGSEILVKGTGLTVQEAFSDFTKRLPSMIFYQHNTAIIIGERAAKEDLGNIVENFIRYPGARPRTFLLVTQGEAFKVLQAKPDLASNLSKEIKKLAEQTAQQNGVSYGVTLIEFTKGLLKADRDSVISKIILYKTEKGEESVPETIIVEGLGVTSKNKLAGWLNQEETLGYLFITQKVRNAEIPIPIVKDEAIFSFWLEDCKSSIKSEFNGGTPTFTISIKAKGAIHENNGLPLDSEEILTMEEAIEDRMRSIAIKTITKSKEYNSDFLGLTEKLHRFHPSSWKEIALDWRERFKESDIKVEVEASIKNIGTTSKKLDIPQ
jgi:spore germination protein KC